MLHQKKKRFNQIQRDEKIDHEHIPRSLILIER